MRIWIGSGISLFRQDVGGGGLLIATAIPDAARPTPSASRIPPTPVAAATRPASAGITTWPTRLPVIRSVSAVPQTSGGAIYMTPERVSVDAMPMAKPRRTSTTYIVGSDSGNASTRKPAAPPPLAPVELGGGRGGTQPA